MIRFAFAVYRHLNAATAVPLVLGLAAVALLPGLKLETDGRVLLPHDHPALVSDRAFEARYGRTDPVLVMVETAAPNGIYAPANLGAIYRLTALAMEVEGIDARAVKSLSTVVVPRMTPEGLRVAPLVSHALPSRQEAALIQAVASTDPLVAGRLVSGDGRAAAIYVPLDSDFNHAAIIESLSERLSTHIAAAGLLEISLRITGPAVAQTQLATHIIGDLAVRLPIAIALVGALLWAWFRSWALVCIGLGQAMLLIVVCFGAMSLAGRPLTLVTAIMPLILATYSLVDSIHIAEKLRTRRSAGALDPLSLLRCTLSELGRPIVVTSVTTAAGFLAFAFSPLPPVRDFGVFTALGICSSLLLSLFLVPPLIVQFCDTGNIADQRSRVGRQVGAFSAACARRPYLAVSAVAAVVAVLAIGLRDLRVQDSWIDNFSNTSPVAQAHARFNELFSGTDFINVVFDADADGFWFDPTNLRALEQIEESLRALPDVGGSHSAAGHTQAIPRVLEGAQRLPTSSEETQQWLLLHAMAQTPGNIDPLMQDEAGRTAVLQVSLKHGSFASTEAVLRRLRQELDKDERLRSVSISLSGNAVLGHALTGAVAQSLAASIAAAMITIAAIAFVTCRSLHRTVLILMPVSCSVLCIFGFMGWAGIPVGVATSTFAAIALGTGIDFAVYWVERFDFDRAQGLSIGEAAYTTSSTTGLATLLHGTILVGGFAVLLLSGVPPIRSLGLLLCVSLGTALFATLVLLPAGVALFHRSGAVPASLQLLKPR